MFEYIGIDVSKQTIQVFDGEKDNTFPNEPELKAFDRFILNQKRKKNGEPALIFEPTGPYSHYLKMYCVKHRIKAHILNPMQSAHFAKAKGNRSKTDKVDARMLQSAHALLREEDFKVPYESAIANQIGVYLLSSYLLTQMVTRLNNHLYAMRRFCHPDQACQVLLESEQHQLEKTKEEMMKRALAWIQQDPLLSSKMAFLCSIPGVGNVTALNLLYHFQKYPQANPNQLTSLAGLDPVTRVSGTSLHQRLKISKRGNPLLRRALYCAAMSGIRCNASLKEQYEALLARKKPKKVALVALMKQILLIGFALYRNNRYYEERERTKKN
jgi:transposase